MTFSMSFPKVLKRTMGLNYFGESYDSLLGFGMIIVVEVLKWKGQWPNSKHALAMLMIPFRYILSFIMLLRCFYESLSGLETNKLLHLVIELMNSFSEKGTYKDGLMVGI